MSLCGMRQMEERHVANCVESMVWCSRLDLLAISNNRGEVSVHRLNWQRVWTISPPNEASSVRAMAWRPDGKVLAIGYSCGLVCLVDVEDKETLHSFNVEKSSGGEECKGVTCITWSQRATLLSDAFVNNDYDDASNFLPNPPSLNGSFGNKKLEEDATNFKELKEQNELNILLIGFGNGKIFLSIFGQFPCGIIDITKLKPFKDPVDIKIINIQIASDFDLLHIFFMEKDNLSMLTLDTDVLSAYSEELFALARKHSQITNLSSYVDQTVTSIIEAWEQILLEMDSKLAKYAANVPEGGVSADLLDLLMMGVPSDELELFLLQDLTAKGLKKFGSSIELSYSTIQKLVLKQLNTVTQNLLYYLSELRGLARIICRYEILGLEESTVSQAIVACGAFLNKCLELQQVIDHSMKNYKAFFRWLYVVIVRLLDEHVPNEIVKITQQDLTYIAEFLQNFDRVGKVQDSGDADDSRPIKTGKFNLERLGQYLINKNLTILPEDDDNPWIKFLTDNPCFENSETILPLLQFRNYSLVQQQEHLRTKIFNVFLRSEQTISTHFRVKHFLQCRTLEEISVDDQYRVTQIHKPEVEAFYVAFTHLTHTELGFYFLELSTKENVVTCKGARFFFEPTDMNESKYAIFDRKRFNVVDVQFYSTDLLSVLLQHPSEDETTIFVQFPITSALPNCKLINSNDRECLEKLPNVEGTALLERGIFKVLDKMGGFQFAVSGGRKVSVVLSRSRRKIRILEMEVEGDEEEDETLDSTVPSVPSDTSHTSFHDASMQGSSMNISSTDILS